MEHTTQPKSADAEPELPHNPTSPPLATISGGDGGDSSPPETQSLQISSPPPSAHSPPLSPLRLSSPPASPSPVHSPEASTISSGHSSCGSHVSSLSEEHLHRPPPETTPSPPHPPEVPVARRLVQEEPKAVTVLDPGAQEAFSSQGDVEDRDAAAAAASNNTGNHDNRRSRRPELSILRKAKRKDTVRRVLLGFRILGFIFCLVSFSVMAADKNQGWALDSFSRYKEFRYSMAVNVIGCAYSGLQAAELAYRLATGKQSSRNHLRRYYVDFFLDQILAYLLMSSSSSASTRVEDWQSNWGKDKFPSIASASVGLSFTAFVALALSSLASGYLLCTLRSSM